VTDLKSKGERNSIKPGDMKKQYPIARVTGIIREGYWVKIYLIVAKALTTWQLFTKPLQVCRGRTFA